jgi:hypothetical protein
MELALWYFGKNNMSHFTGPLDKLLAIGELFIEIYCSYTNADTWRRRKPLTTEYTEVAKDGSSLFLEVLASGRSLSATNSRDYIYAFLGNPNATGDTGELVITPDYAKNTNDVYTDFVTSLLFNHPAEAPYVLAFVDHAAEEDLSGQFFPSWVPRWDKGSYQNSIALPTFWFSTGGQPSDFRPRATKFGGKMFLELQGSSVGSVSYASARIHRPNFRTDSRQWEEAFRLARSPFVDELRSDVAAALDPPMDSRQLDLQLSLALVRGYPKASHSPSDAKLEKHLAGFDVYCSLMRGDSLATTTTPEQRACAAVIEYDCGYANYYRVAVINSSRICLVPRFTRPTDLCYVVAGMKTPIILRCNGRGQYNFVGCCYVSGIMSGELTALEQPAKVTKEAILIE